MTSAKAPSASPACWLNFIACLTSSYLFCCHPWLLAWLCATRRGLFAARPPTLRVCARAVRATRSPRAHGSLPYGQPSAPVGLRIRAYSSQRGRQRLTAAATQQPPHATGNRLPAAPPAADAQQRPPEAVPGPRRPLLQPEPASSTSERLRAPDSPSDAACYPGRRRT